MVGTRTIYLCGPIHGRADADCRNWRALIRTQWEGRVLDPMRRDFRGREDQNVSEIVTLDKIDIANSDALLVNFDAHSVGTSMEIYIAFTTGKLVVVVVPANMSLSPWLRYHSHKITSSFNDALQFIRDTLK